MDRKIATVQERVRRLRSLARMLDASIKIPGTNYWVGLESLIGLIPVAGDLIGGAFSLYIVSQAAQMGVPAPVLARMILNVAIDLGAGAVPLAGDVFDVVWKANMKNLDLLERHLGLKS